MSQAYVYILANKRNGTLYTGMTSHLPKRMEQHRLGKGSAFAAEHGCGILVYCEPCESIMQAREREHQIKAGSRKKKLALIEATNPQWKNLMEEWL